jgi:hypothetical protein
MLAFALLSWLIVFSSSSMDPSAYDSAAQAIVREGLTRTKAFDLLHELCTTIGHRLSGSPGAEKAVAWSKRQMESIGLDRVWLEPVTVPKWVRGKTEELVIVEPSSLKKETLRITALGGSVGAKSLTAGIVEVKSFDELSALGDQARGKIVFFNVPWEVTQYHPGFAYGTGVKYRGLGAIEGARVGAVAVIVRSMSSATDDVPHTGAMRSYDDALPKIPAAAISPVSADKLSRLIREQTGMKCRLTLDCETQGEVESANVIGEIRGTEKPEEVIVVSGHLDSWDKGQGAHDDGAGCMQSIEALRLIKAAGLKPKRTIRAVLFMNEENGLRGAKAYAEKERPGEKHILAIESDAGGFAPRGFGIDADSTVVPRLQRWASVLRLIDADRVAPGWGGADIGELRKKGVPCLGLKPDPQRYFDYHHSDLDTIDKVNPRELELGAIAMAIFSYIFAQEGLE